MTVLRILLLLLFAVSTCCDDVFENCDAQNLVSTNPKWNKVAEHILREEWSKAEKVLRKIPPSVHSTCVRIELAILENPRKTTLKSLIGIDPIESVPPDDTHPQIARRVAEMLQMESQLSAAVKWYEKAVTVNIENVKSLNVFSNLIECLVKLNRIEEAHSYFTAAALSKSKFVELQRRYAMFLTSNGRAEEAEQHLVRLSKRFPKVAEYHVALTYVLEHRLHDERVLRKITDHLQLALTLSPSIKGVHLRIGKFLMRQSRFTEATTHLQRAVRNVFLERARTHTHTQKKKITGT